MELVLYAGLVNWLATTIIVEGEVFKEVREWFDNHAPKKLGYLVHCHLCAGTWVGLGLSLFVPGPIVTVPLVAWFLNALLYKAVGHLILQAFAWGEATVAITQKAAHPEVEKAEAAPKPLGYNETSVVASAELEEAWNDDIE